VGPAPARGAYGADDEVLDLSDGAHDLVIHDLSLHWAEDPVGQIVQCARALRPDGLLIATLFGGATLSALRTALAEAEVEATGGLSPRVVPMGEIRDLGNLLGRAGLALPVADAIPYPVSYPDAFALLRDLRAMGEGNALQGRLRHVSHRTVLMCAMGRYPLEEGRAVARFEVVTLTGWKPAASQPKPLRPARPCGGSRTRWTRRARSARSDAALGRRAPDAYVMVFMESEGTAPSVAHGRAEMNALTPTTPAVPAHAPADHPAVAPARIGVLLANLGTPDDPGYWSMRRYLSEFLSDRRVIDYPAWKWQPLLQTVILAKRPFTSGANYRKIWNRERNESPLLTITKAQTEGLRDRLQARFGDGVRVDFCMRYGNPSTQAAVHQMVEEGCRRILFVPLYPHYAGATSATACDQFFRALMAETWQPIARVAEPYFEDPAYIAALAARSGAAGRGGRGARAPGLLLSRDAAALPYAGRPLPLPVPEDDALLREALGWDRPGRTTFQSVFGPEEWLKPYTVEEVARLAKEEA
jgi:ferrochelatase